MKIKKEVKKDIENAFNTLREKGYIVYDPQLDINLISVYDVGEPFPEDMVSGITVEIKIRLTEKDLEIEK